MARQSGMSTPIFDELLREMTEGLAPSPPPTPGATEPETGRAQPPAPRRRHRAD
jgi:hypothetical protein